MKDITCKDVIREIIEQMKRIIGPVAVTQANMVEGLSVNGKITLKRDPVRIITKMIEQYKSIIGPVALTIARRGARAVLEKNPRLKVPEELR